MPTYFELTRLLDQFGSVVSSYFTFLRWIFWVNFIITSIIVFMVVIPESLADATADEERRNLTWSRKHLSDEHKSIADHLTTVWDFGVGYFH